MQSYELAKYSKSNKPKLDFRFILQDELKNRCSRNPNYSLRSFAKALDISPSALSAIISGKRPVTHKMKTRLGFKLGLNADALQSLSSSPHGNSKLNSEKISDTAFHQVTVDTFAVISEPHHYALLELIKTKDFKWNPKWISKRLKVSTKEVSASINRLERVGLLEKNKQGELVDATKGFSTDLREGLSSQAHRKYQQKSLQSAIDAVEKIDVNLRDNTSITMAIDTEDLPEAKKYIKEFRRKFCSRLESASNLNEVYQLTVSFIPMTNNDGESK